MTSLRSWLRRNPQPEKLRYTTEDDEERDLKLSANARGRWKDAEDALMACRATSVQCLDGKGAVIRAMPLTYEDGEGAGGPVDPEEREERRAEKIVGKERRELAGVLDRYGLRLTEAFQAGADAASSSQDKLVALVETLTAHLSNAISNLHGLSVQYAMAIQRQGGGEEPEDPNSKMVAQVIGTAVAGFMAQGGVMPKTTTPPAPPNGKK